jgi:hypothetical protein
MSLKDHAGRSRFGEGATRRFAWAAVALAFAVELCGDAWNVVQTHANPAWWANPVVWWFLTGPALLELALAPSGVWLIVSAVRRGPGRFGWRWWTGGLLLLLPTTVFFGDILEGNPVLRVVPDDWGFIDLSNLFLLLLIPPLWILAAPRRSD